MPGLASLRAALRPAKTDALYYVARGDGSSEFSRTLDEHNRAVRKYQLQGELKRHLRGKFITLEGVDGAGKSTHMRWIAERLRAGAAARWW